MRADFSLTRYSRAALCGFVLSLAVGGLSLVGFSAQAQTGLLNIRGEVVNFKQEKSLLLNTQGRREWVIQFDSPLRGETRREMKAHQIEILRYLPPNAFVVRGESASLDLLQAQKLVGYAPWKSNWKIDRDLAPKLSARPFLNSSEAKRPLRVWVMAFDESAAQRLSKELDKRGLTHMLEGRTLDVLLERNQILEISEMMDIENIEEAPQVEVLYFDPGAPEMSWQASNGKGDYSDVTGYETGTRVMNFEVAWAQGLRGQGQTVAFADTGLDMGVIPQLSPDFASAVRVGHIIGIGARDWSDPMGHGTHVAGSIGGRGTASGGLFQGGANEASLLPQGMWSPLIDNLSVPPKLEKLFAPAMADGAYLHSNSWGSPRNLGAYDGMAVQVDEFSWKNQDFLPIFAAGNSGVDKDKDGVIDQGSISSPGTAKNALTVGASENLNSTGGIQNKISDLRSAKESWSAEPIWSSKLSDNVNGIAVFSSRGPTGDGRLKPEIVAPGTNILSNKSHAPGAQDLWGAYNADYVYSGGTSMATPLAAGAAAVARQVLQSRFQVAQPSAALVKAVLLHTAVDLYPGQYGEGHAQQELRHRPEVNQGYGRADLQGLSRLAGQTQVIDERTGIATGETKDYVVRVGAGESLIVNLVYMDAPGTPAASRALVNDLDLEAQGPGLQRQAQDRVNNHEIIEASNLAGGDIRIRVRAQNVPMGLNSRQPYALVISHR